MQKIKEMVPMLLPLIVTFYHIYPQALNVAGSSFILLSGPIGLMLYAYHRFPFREAISLLVGLVIMFFIFYTSGSINMYSTVMMFGYPKSQIAWFFSSYLIVFLIYTIHKKPTINTVLLYISAAVGLQALIAMGMNMNEGIQDFFFSLQMQVEYTEEIMDEGASQRVMGYGIGFFGAGALSGLGLVTISYLLMRMDLKPIGFILLVAMYVLIFYIGVFMARTTIVGMAVGLGLIGILYIWDNKTNIKQAKTFFLASIFLMIGGYFFVMSAFPHFADWAFELFINFIERGELTTTSSSGLSGMFKIPDDVHTLIFGTGSMDFSGTDVGYSRMLFWVGVPGTLYFFLYQWYIVRLSFTKDWGINSVSIALFVYVLILNIKGWIDLNLVLFMIFFYFTFYKHYVYLPKQEAKIKTIGDIKREKRALNKMR